MGVTSTVGIARNLENWVARNLGTRETVTALVSGCWRGTDMRRPGGSEGPWHFWDTGRAPGEWHLLWPECPRRPDTNRWGGCWRGWGSLGTGGILGWIQGGCDTHIVTMGVCEMGGLAPTPHSWGSRAYPWHWGAPAPALMSGGPQLGEGGQLCALELCHGTPWLSACARSCVTALGVLKCLRPVVHPSTPPYLGPLAARCAGNCSMCWGAPGELLGHATSFA